MDTTNWVTTLNSVVKNLMSGNSSQFLSFGFAVATGLAVVLIVRYGVTTALSGRAFDFGDFFQEVILLVGACLSILKGYSTPMTIFGGNTFPDLIIDGPAQLANQISLNSNAQLEALFQTILNVNAPPTSAFDIAGLFSYWVYRGSIELTRGLMFAVTSYGLVAQAVVVLVGPVFIPFLLFRPMSFMFWGWFRCLLQYSFYPLVCACFSSVLTSFMINLPMNQVAGTLTAAQVLAMLPFFIVVMLGMLSVPLLVSGLFSGSSSSGGPLSRLMS